MDGRCGTARMKSGADPALPGGGAMGAKDQEGPERPSETEGFVAGIDIVKAEGIEVATEYPAHGHKVEGGVRARTVSPPEFSLWLVTADLDDGASITWPAEHGDESVFVVSGAFQIDGRTCPADGAVIIE